jgi:alanyl-tRNA synthetase
VLPSNEGRGYVLRRIMRRAMRHAQLLGAKRAADVEAGAGAGARDGPGLSGTGARRALITETLKLEETRFRKTLVRGLGLLSDATARCKGDMLDGETAFKLYDTYGFPLDLTQDALRNRGISVDLAGFTDAMEQQKAEARVALDRLRRHRDRDDLVRAARKARRDRVPRLRDRAGGRRGPGAGP